MQQGEITRLYFDHGEELYHFLLRKVSCAETAADLKQETFVKLMRGSIEEPLENPRAYLFRVASNLVTDHFRKQSTRAKVMAPGEEIGVADDAPAPDRVLLAKDELARLRAIIEALPDRQRDVLILHKFEGLSYDGIAERLGISKNTVTAHMVRALMKCREALSDAGPEQAKKKDD